ncbi:F-box/kelch-repeat protein At3g23880 [Daucus carota subsp. sativus]|uniref:F-box/kelch-repeat protein At3g23880 n=1 Tax=Daucus carota subsp. sativus TaxID=79200 RepID=UPI0007EFC0D2|nr:PREDICTED: F-box/kelch-repeat protein At3g23880-like [Daucus carota subsp. sativus]
MATTPPLKNPRLPENEPTYTEPPELPEDIIFTKILPRLPAKSVGRFRSVCKAWRSLLSKTSFTKDHLNCTTQNPNDDNLIINKFITESNRKYHEIDVLSLSDLSETKLFDLYEYARQYPLFRLIGSIHGIVCLYLKVGIRNQFVLWNPVIKQAKAIASPEHSIGLWGFCWDEVKADFKADARSGQPVIRFSEHYDEEPHPGVPAAIVNGVPYWQYSQRLRRRSL